MKKGVIVVCIAITVLAAIGIVVVLVMGLNGYGWFGNFGNFGNFRFNNLRSGSTGSQVVLKEEELSFEDVEALYVDCVTYDIVVSTTLENTAAIRQYGDTNTPSSEYFTLTQSGNRVNVHIDELTNRSFIGINIVVINELHLLIPQDWIGELSLLSVSGDIDMKSAFDLTTVSLASTSGDVYLQELSADTLKVDTVSGNFTTRYPLVLQDSVSIKSISGDFEMDDITADIYDFSSSSGEIACRLLEGYGNITTISGDCDITGLSLTGNTSINTTSGDVSVGIDRDASLRLEANSTSGELSSYLGGVRDNFVGSSISATYGDNPVGTLTFQSMSGDLDVVPAVISAGSAA